jgi:fatty-acyl-CoA synthase
MQEIIIMDTILLVVPQFHVMAWVSVFMSCCLDQTWCYPLSNLQPEALIKILQEVTKANGVPLFGHL